MNYDDYLKLSNKELKKLVAHIKNIQHLRAEETKKLLTERDTSKLLVHLKENNNSLSSQFHGEIHFSNLTHLDIPFIDALKTCKEWPEIKIFALQNGVTFAFHDPVLFDYYYKHHPDLLYANRSLAFASSNKEVAQKMFDLKFIDFSKNIPNTFEEFLRHHSETVLITAIKNCPEFFTTDAFYKIYMFDHLRFPKETLEYLFQLSPPLKELTLSQIIANNLNPNPLDKKYYESAKNMFKIDHEQLKFLLKTHLLDDNSLDGFFTVINNSFRNEGVMDTFFVIIDHIKEHQPDLSYRLFELRDQLKVSKLKSFYEKALLVFSLETDLEEKQNQRKLKI